MATNEYMNARYHKRQDAGLCVRCGKVKVNGTSRCDACRESHNKLTKKYMAIKAEKRICNSCSKPNDNPNNKRYCVECAKKNSEKARKDWEFFKSIGICPRCRTNPIFGKEKSCLECKAKLKTSDEKRVKKSKENHKKRYEYRKSMGLCTKCGNPTDGSTMCTPCREKNNKRSLLYHRRKANENRITRNEYPDYGMCYTCGNPIEEGFRVCKECREKLKINSSKSIGKNDYWRKTNKLFFAKEV